MSLIYRNHDFASAEQLEERSEGGQAGAGLWKIAQNGRSESSRVRAYELCGKECGMFVIAARRRAAAHARAAVREVADGWGFQAIGIDAGRVYNRITVNVPGRYDAHDHHDVRESVPGPAAEPTHLPMAEARADCDGRSQSKVPTMLEM